MVAMDLEISQCSYFGYRMQKSAKNILSIRARKILTRIGKQIQFVEMDGFTFISLDWETLTPIENASCGHYRSFQSKRAKEKNKETQVVKMDGQH